MTTEDRYIVDLADIRAVRLDCVGCGASVVFKSPGWDKIPYQCPACAVSWHHGEHTTEFQNVNRLAVGLRTTIAAIPNMAFRVRLELDEPK